MVDLARFEQYYKLADLLIEQSTKEQRAKSARLLALNVRCLSQLKDKLSHPKHDSKHQASVFFDQAVTGLNRFASFAIQ